MGDPVSTQVEVAPAETREGEPGDEDVGVLLDQTECPQVPAIPDNRLVAQGLLNGGSVLRVTLRLQPKYMTWHMTQNMKPL